MTKSALVVGAGGAAAKRLCELLLKDGSWSVLGIVRRSRSSSDGVTYRCVDLLDPDSCARALSDCTGITHIFYAARAKHAETGVEDVDENVAMLRNVLDAVEPTAQELQHVHLVQGTKYYGMHLGPFPTPAREDDARHMPPNFYYDQQGLLIERKQGRNWNWSASRPNFICDFAPERARNVITVTGAYAAISAELGLPLDFPGPQLAFDTLHEVTDASLLARAIRFIATTPTCANQAFNVTNGDVFRWRSLWPRIASYFGCELGIVRPLKLAEWMRDKQPIWERIVRRHGLHPSPLEEVADWSFGEFLWSQCYDVISQTTKLHNAGFYEVVDTLPMFIRQLSCYSGGNSSEVGGASFSG